MKTKFPHSFIFSTILLGLIVCLSEYSTAQKTNTLSVESGNYKTIKIKPSNTDPSVHTWDSVHIVYYDSTIKNNKILLWLTGTNGSTDHIPIDFLTTAIEQGYRIIALSFISSPGVSQVCVGEMLNNNVDCAAEFRRKRIYGDNYFSSIPDETQDAIIPRLIKLLQYLSKNDLAGNWSQYLDKNSSKPKWSKIAIAGQSQGGGMAEFIAQNENVARIISFSGGWDYSNSKTKKIAGWYYQKLVTPSENIYATYHVNEVAAQELAEICTALCIPKNHVFALDKPLLIEKKGAGNPYHVEGIRNPVYKSIWIKMLGSGL